MTNVNDEIGNVRRQVIDLKLDVDNKTQTIVGNTEKINDEVKSLESKVETLAEEKNVLKRRAGKITEDSQGRGGELIDFYDEGDHVRPFSQTPKYADQIFQRPQICWPNFQKPPKIMLTTFFF